jgi:hypothetical protein
MDSPLICRLIMEKDSSETGLQIPHLPFPYWLVGERYFYYIMKSRQAISYSRITLSPIRIDPPICGVIDKLSGMICAPRKLSSL